MKYLDYLIDFLELDSYIYNILIDNNIFKISDLYILNRKMLKSFGLNDRCISQIIIKLELLGLDLNGKKYQFLLTILFCFGKVLYVELR